MPAQVAGYTGRGLIGAPARQSGAPLRPGQPASTCGSRPAHPHPRSRRRSRRRASQCHASAAVPLCRLRAVPVRCRCRRRRRIGPSLFGSAGTCWPSADDVGRAAAPGPTPDDRHAALELAGLVAEQAADRSGTAAVSSILRAHAGDRRRRTGRLADRAGPARRRWTSCAPGPTPATGTPPGGVAGLRGTGAETWTSCTPGPPPGEQARPPRSWPACWPSAEDLDGAVHDPRAHRAGGHGDAAGRLADLLARRGDLDETSLRAQGRRTPAMTSAASRLADLLAQRGDLDELRGRGRGQGVRMFDSRAADLLAERDLDELRGRADAGDEDSAARSSACWPGAKETRECGTWTSCAAGPTRGDEDAADLAELTCWPSAETSDRAARPGQLRRQDTPPGRTGRPAGRARRT